MDCFMLTTFLGITGAVITFILWIPQARTTWLNRQRPEALAGISLGTQSLMLLNSFVWGGYAIALNEFWVGAAGIVNAPLAVITMSLILKGRRLNAKEENAIS